jgi:predicted AAA+ superfamily ATPase
LQQFAKTISNANIIKYDFNDLELQSLTYIELHKEILGKSVENKVNYLFLDEIQEIEK